MIIRRRLKRAGAELGLKLSINASKKLKTSSSEDPRTEVMMIESVVSREPSISRRCGTTRSNEGIVHWRVWAPFAQRVQLVFKGQDELPPLEMAPTGHGYFEIEAHEDTIATHYMFRLDDRIERPDPCSLWQPQGVHGPSALYFPGAFRWTDELWNGVEQSDLVIYELHIGTFTPEGTFDAAIARLAELRELGVTAIEIMPISQFAGDRNWGYDGVYPFAAQNSYGGPEALQRFVDAAHRQQLAVILDVVYNHLGPEGNYLAEFGPYFTDRYKTPWGSAVNYDGAGSDGVRNFVLDNARMWLEEFHLDGLRLDAVHAIFDHSPRHILAEIGQVAEEVRNRQDRHVLVIAESDLNDPRIVNPAEQGGYALHAQWNDDFHHAFHAYFTGEDQGYYCDFGRSDQLLKSLLEPFVYSGQYSPHRGRRHGAAASHLLGQHFVVFLQNHDQIGNRARGDRLTTVLTPSQQRLGAAWLLLSPYLPLLFMGEEYGETNPFAFFCSFSDSALIRAVREGRMAEFSAFAWQGEVPDPQAESTFLASKLRWSWPEGSQAAGLRQLYRDLIDARRTWPAMRNFDKRSAQMIQSDGQDSILLLVRDTEIGDERIQCLFNLTDEVQLIPEISPHDRLLLSTEDTKYHGRRTSHTDTDELLPYECQVFGPEHATQYFRC